MLGHHEKPCKYHLIIWKVISEVYFLRWRILEIAQCLLFLKS